MAVNKQRHEAGRRTIPAMIDYECHRCGVRGRVADPEQVSELCHACKAEAAWATLPPETWRMVDEELARNRIVHAIQPCGPPIRRSACPKRWTLSITDPPGRAIGDQPRPPMVYPERSLLVIT
jgi:hypothetical protein